MSNFRRISKHLAVTAALLFCVLFAGSCVSSSGILGTPDETAEAAKLIEAANADLTEIKKLYMENEQLRPRLAEALRTNNAAEVKATCEAAIKLITDGTEFGKNAISKISEAREMSINDTYEKYLKLKQDSLERHLEAFAKFRLAAIALRDNYDPANPDVREKVTVEFENRSMQYREITERARAYSLQANELYQDTIQQQGQ